MTDERNIDSSDTELLERVTDEGQADEIGGRDVRAEAHRLGVEAVARALDQPVADLD